MSNGTSNSGRNGKLDARQVHEIIRVGNGRLVDLVHNLEAQVSGGLRESVLAEAKRRLSDYFQDLESRTQSGENLGVTLFRGIVAYEERERKRRELNGKPYLEQAKPSVFRPFVQVEFRKDEKPREIRTYNLPTPYEMRKHLAVAKSKEWTPYGIRSSYAVIIPDECTREVYEAGLRQALLGTRARVKVTVTHLQTENANTHMYANEPKVLLEADVRRLAEYAEMGRKKGRAVEFEVTHSGGKFSGVKFFLYTLDFPVVTLSTVPLDKLTLQTKTEEYHTTNLELAQKKLTKEAPLRQYASPLKSR